MLVRITKLNVLHDRVRVAAIQPEPEHKSPTESVGIIKSFVLPAHKFGITFLVVTGRALREAACNSDQAHGACPGVTDTPRLAAGDTRYWHVARTSLGVFTRES